MVRRRKQRKLTGYETSLTDYMKDYTEKLWCEGCLEMVAVVNMDNDPIFLLSCGHRTTREISVNCKDSYDLHMEFGWPNPNGGWYKMREVHWPLPSEMKHRTKYEPELVGKIRKFLGKEDWEPC